MKKEYKYASIFFLIIAVGVISISYFYDEVDLKRNTTDDTNIDDKKFLRSSPKLQGISGYINTSSDQINQDIEGKVVIYDFWNSNYNSRNTGVFQSVSFNCKFSTSK